MVYNWYCPYCKSAFLLNKKRLNKIPRYGIVTCECDSYPIVEGIFFVKKDDGIIHRKIIDLINTKKYLNALWLSLYDQHRNHKIVLFSLLFLRSIGINPDQRFFLQILELVGPSRSWFTYLLKSKTRNTLKTAVQVIKEHSKSGDVVVDIGCGWGHLEEEFAKSTEGQKPYFIGLDKSMFSLFVASLYQKNKNAIYFCCDVEVGLPLGKNEANVVLFLDSFAWVYQKDRLIAESQRILKKNGQIVIVNVHVQSPETRWWGYGINKFNLKKMMSKYFTQISFFAISLGSNNAVVYLKKINRNGYSCLAQKK